MILLINNAQESIHLQTYIYDDDETGLMVADALKAAVKRNVSVYLLADGYASQQLSKSFISEIRHAGIHFRFFEPLFKSRNFYFGRRMHHKVVVADARVAIVGGINISNRYNDMPGKTAWLDFALYTEGEIARQLCILCWKTWNAYPLKMGITPCEEKQSALIIPEGESTAVRMRRNDWVRHKNEISGTYIEMMGHAEKQVTILCSYFLPGKLLRRQIKHAAKRGVSIRVIAAGSSDVMMAKRAERWLYDWLLRNGIELFEYQQNILHGKLAVCDDQWMTIGSYNINNLSTYASIELNLDVKDPKFAGSVREILDGIISKNCIPITAGHLVKTKNIFRQFSRWLSYECLRILFYLFTFYYKRQHKTAGAVDERSGRSAG